MSRRRDKSVLGAVVLLVVFLLFAIVFAHIPARLTAPRGHTLTATFADAQTLTKGDPVRVNGVLVGTVSSIEQGPGGRGAVVKMSVSGDALPLYSDAHATLRWRTLFGASFYVDLDRGTPGRPQLQAARLTARQTDTQVVLEDITSVIARQGQAGFRSLLREFPHVLRDPAVPDRTLTAIADTATPVQRGFGALRGQRDGDLANLVRRTATTVKALDAPDDGVRELVAGAAQTFGVTARRRDAIRRSLTSAQDVLPRVRRTTARLGRTLRLADPLLERLDASAAPLEPTAVRLHTTLTRARALLDAAGPLLNRLRPAATSLAAAARVGAPLLRDISPSVQRVADRILPGLAERSSDTGLRGYTMVGPAFAGLTGNFASFDGSGNFLRFTATGAESTFDDAPCRTTLTDPSAAEKVQCEALFAALKQVLKPTPAKRSRP